MILFYCIPQSQQPACDKACKKDEDCNKRLRSFKIPNQKVQCNPICILNGKDEGKDQQENGNDVAAH